MARRILKILHELGAIGLTGALAVHMILLATTSADSLAEYAVVRRNIAIVSQWLLVPSLAVVLVSGLFAMAVQPAFHNAGWVWAKLILGLPTFEGTLALVDARAQKAAEISARVAAGAAETEAMAELLRSEWTSLWLILLLSVASTVIGVWRPRRRRRTKARAPARPPSRSAV